MRKYREELDQIHMSEELKQRIRHAAAKQGHPQRRQKQQLRFIYGCTALCVVIVICFNVYDRNALSQQPENAAQIANSIEKNKAADEAVPGTVQEQAKESKTGSAQDRVIPKETYEPQTKTYMIGGMGVTDKAFIQKKKIKEMPYEKDRLDIQSTLPVFRKQYGNGANLDSIPEKEMQKHKKKAEELFQTIKKKTSKILNITDIMADGNGELRLILHTDKKEGTRTQQQKIAEELIKTYPELFSFQRGDIQTSCNISMGNGTMICETEIFQAEDDDKKSLLYQVKEGATLTNAGDGVYYLSFPYDKNLEQLQDFTIMSRKEAEQVMRQGGFYSTLEPSEFSIGELEFLHVELSYGGRKEGYVSYLPYVIPVYRFYTWDAGTSKTVLLEVPALYPQDLRTLEDNHWYFKV